MALITSDCGTTLTALQQDGPDHLGLSHNAPPCASNGPNHLEFCAPSRMSTSGTRPRGRSALGSTSSSSRRTWRGRGELRGGAVPPSCAPQLCLPVVPPRCASPLCLPVVPPRCVPPLLLSLAQLCAAVLWLPVVSRHSPSCLSCRAVCVRAADTSRVDHSMVVTNLKVAKMGGVEVRPPTTWTVLQNDDPNHLGLGATRSLSIK